MQLPQGSTPISRCETASLFTQHAFQHYVKMFHPGPETAAHLESLVALLRESTDVLVRAQGEYRAAVTALIAPRVELKLVDLNADDLVRSVKRAADEAGKDVASMAFPSGITPIVRPVGATEVKALRDLEARIGATTRWEARAEQAARVEAVRKDYEAALAARADAMRAAADKRLMRDAIKEDYLDAFARVGAAVKGLFPRDRRRQDVFFDDLRSSGRRTGGDEEQVDEPDELDADSAE